MNQNTQSNNTRQTGTVSGTDAREKILIAEDEEIILKAYALLKESVNDMATIVTEMNEASEYCSPNKFSINGRTYGTSIDECIDKIANARQILDSFADAIVGVVDKTKREKYIADHKITTTPKTTAPTTPKTTPKTTAKTTPKTTAKTTPKTTAKTTPKTTAKTTPKTTAQTNPPTRPPQGSSQAGPNGEQPPSPPSGPNDPNAQQTGPNGEQPPSPPSR